MALGLQGTQANELVLIDQHHALPERGHLDLGRRFELAQQHGLPAVVLLRGLVRRGDGRLVGRRGDDRAPDALVPPREHQRGRRPGLRLHVIALRAQHVRGTADEFGNVQIVYFRCQFWVRCAGHPAAARSFGARRGPAPPEQQPQAHPARQPHECVRAEILVNVRDAEDDQQEQGGSLDEQHARAPRSAQLVHFDRLTRGILHTAFRIVLSLCPGVTHRPRPPQAQDHRLNEPRGEAGKVLEPVERPGGKVGEP